MTTFLRIATLVVLGSATGLAGWWTWILQDKLDGQERRIEERNERIDLLEGELTTSRERMQHLDGEVRAKAAEVTRLSLSLKETEAALGESEEQRQAVEAALALSKIDHRTARLEVLEQSTDAAGVTTTRVRFLEVGDDGQPLGEGQIVEIQGTRVYLEALVIKFGDDFVEGADALRGTSICLFQRLFGEDTPASEGHALDTVGQRPHPYLNGDTADPYFEELWKSFWDYAHDPAAAEAKGVRTLHGEAPWIEARPGGRYRVELRSAGGLSITAE